MKFLCFCVIVVINAAPDEDLVSALPGYNGSLPSKIYSGFINASATKHLHYVFVESQNAPSDDPIAIWMNGGPGCSSLDGFLYEHGPFRFKAYNGTGLPELELFEYSWTYIANMVYLEQPVGVGFSYSSAQDTTEDYTCSDDTVAVDNLAAIQAFFEKFPEFKNNDFFITGESYAGIYVPVTAEAILQAGDNYTGAALKGIGVGNGCSGDEIGICAFSDSTQGSYYTTKYLMQTAFVPDTLKDEISATCDFDTWSQGGEIGSACSEIVLKLDALTEKLDTYCVYCDCGEQFSATTLQQHTFLQSSPKISRHQMRHKNIKKNVATTACIDSDAASAWLNTPSVQEALHVTQAQVSNWAVCTDAAGWSYESTRPNLPRDTYPGLISQIRVTIYNGDWDACVPYTDNEAWTSNMNYTTKKEWHPWTLQVDGYTSVGGYATTYEVDGPGFQFTTVRGGRHEVPETAPERAYAMAAAIFSQSDL
mmetsp:Transcript_24183/g.31463  ORF Transcript_24183/g.31463 Transcript_24183/m.31463 type:complete len:479 (+) Transcript_24183:188-1624(+)|eukprot:CAMPEP_0197289296 /NCGR_PEP_ID=MMETSP0890-20130614/6532_1 /TAXON_ID=44058 ORGANISM="Aureoumbra lagunensis, Strain CCMP1510" /NCGR_SAMPLE_ID=MMETSP0890 /ASSEMBLY_ACC=CAM_ASM_000533 /LENGTH=478 /DNA_ID=CAMNT_0042760609 /DNA_START=109 /DNA_END=1545 /DNA_ORIENTATION=-